MEDAPLNKAHQQHRRAEAHARYKRFDEAIQCHMNAAEFLILAMRGTSSTKAMESLSMQRSYHIKQAGLLRSKKDQYEKEKVIIDKLKLLAKDSTNETVIQQAISRAFEETDSLLETLFNLRESANDSNENSSNKISGDKKRKDSKTVAEEIQIWNKNLKTLVNQLILQGEVLKGENLSMKDRIKYLESERKQYLNLIESDDNDSDDIDNLRVLTDSIEVTDTPLVTSPCFQIGPGQGGAADIELLELAPLELPNFNLENFRNNLPPLDDFEKSFSKDYRVLK